MDISGGISEQIVVEVDRDRLLGYNLSISYLSNFLTADNVLFPGGSVDNGNQTLTVRTDGLFGGCGQHADYASDRRYHPSV